jgi:hypothetical protein
MAGLEAQIGERGDELAIDCLGDADDEEAERRSLVVGMLCHRHGCSI